LTHAKGPTTIADFQYQFNAVNNITQIIDAAGTHGYSYDSLDRLTAATHPNQANESYTYDDVGNRTASQQGSSYTYQSFNRLVSANGTSYAYDTNGNLTSKTDATESWSYTWDYENRLKQASLSGGVTVTYSYDALGRRIQRSSPSSTTRFVYDGADVMRDLDGTGATIADYLNGPGIDNKLRQTVSGASSYLFADHLGTTRGLTDTNGSVSSSLAYDSFGNLTSGSTASRYTYTSREIDTDTGLMYYPARWYDPAQARFVSEDPIGLEGGINLYAYVANDSVNYTDPLGLKRLKPYSRTRHASPAQSCVCKAEEPDAEDDSFLTLLGSYGIGVAKGFSGAAIGTAELPIDLVKDPTGTVTAIVDDIGMRIQTLGEIAIHPVAGYDAIIDAIMVIGPNKAMETLGDAGGQLIFFKGMADLGQRIRAAREPELGENCRIARLGNRTDHPYGRWPHYHRRGPRGPDGNPLPGQGIKRHRPFEPSKHDKRFTDRF